MKLAYGGGWGLSTFDTKSEMWWELEYDVREIQKTNVTESILRQTKFIVSEMEQHSSEKVMTSHKKLPF